MASFSKPIRRIRGGVLSAHFWVRVNDGGRRTWRSTGEETLALAKERLKTWLVRDAKGAMSLRRKNPPLLTRRDPLGRRNFAFKRQFADFALGTSQGLTKVHAHELIGRCCGRKVPFK